MIHNFARTLAPGDLIIVPYSNHLYPGIFKGYGKGGNIHYFMIRSDQRAKDYVINRMLDGKKVYVDFINRTQDNVIAKLHPDELEASLRAWYDEYKQLLIQNKLI